MTQQQQGAALLGEADLAFFRENGYVVVRNVVPEENLRAAVDAVWDFLELDADDPATWYPADRKGGLAHLHQHQALWDNRQHPPVHRAFAELLGTEALWVSMDRAAMKPPINPAFPHYNDSGFVHWDLDTSKPLPVTLGVQGVLALADTTAEMGGFHCIPGFHRVLEEWIREQPEDRDPRSPDLSRLPPDFEVVPIPMNAGDLVIWDRRLAHGNGRNDGTRPRLAQYITMYPAGDDEEQRAERVACWRERRAPSHWERDIPEKFRGRERQRYPIAELTPLGRRLLGADPW
jgi:hypothetical protein